MSWMRTEPDRPMGAQGPGACQRAVFAPARGRLRSGVPESRIVRPSALAEGIFRREILSWGLLGLALGLVEGATAAVLVKQHFAGVVPRFVVNIAVGLVSGAPAFANVLSFVWANLAHGRARVRLMVALQAVFALLVGCVSFASRAATGLLLTVVAIICARVVWGGILTVRAAVWTANYPRNVLARITGRIVIVNAIAVAISAALVGWALEAHVIDARWLYGGGAAAGLAGARLYRAMRVRREFRLLAAEAASGGLSEPFSLRMLTQILKEDPSYREYMLWMGAVLLGAAQAGANLGWNLGHNDFASIGRAQHYMGVHVTLTGLRGGVAPPLGVLAYMGLEWWHPGAGEFALLLPLAMTAAGAVGFYRMRGAFAEDPGTRGHKP